MKRKERLTSTHRKIVDCRKQASISRFDRWLTGQSLSRAQNISSGVNKLRAREKIGPVNQPLTSQSTGLFNRFAPFFGEVTIGWLTEGH
jgi:hypothetical protein